jgi:hypothetical protein
MDPKVLQKLTLIKQKFRDLPPKEREKLGIALLKINLGVNSEEEFLQAKIFIEGLALELKKDRLDGFMNFLHSTSSKIPVDLLDHSPLSVAHEAIEKQVREDEIETLKDYPKPFPRK